MTRKDYIRLASVLARHHASEEMVNAFCAELKEDNPRFDEHRFRDAAQPLKHISESGQGPKPEHNGNASGRWLDIRTATEDKNCETEPADPIGMLVDGNKVFCFGCEPLNADKVPLYRVNVYPYKQTCTKCGKLLVEPQSPSWPELFT